MSENFKRMLSEVKKEFVGRDVLIDCLGLAIVAHQNIVTFGPPGTAKTDIIKAISSRISGTKFFNYQLDEDTRRDELFGPISLKKLQEERWARNLTDHMAECHIAHLDEVFSGNSIIVNSLRAIMNERMISNDGKDVACPLISVVASSNEIPENPLDSVYDRFLIRLNVEYIKKRSEIGDMLYHSTAGNKDTVSVEEINSLWARCHEVKIPFEIKSICQSILDEISEEQVSEISNRRQFQLMADTKAGVPFASLIKAAAIMDGKTSVEKSHLACLSHCLWGKSRDIIAISDIVTRNIDAFGQKITNFERTITEFSSSVSSNVIKVSDLMGFLRDIENFYVGSVLTNKESGRRGAGIELINTAMVMFRTAADGATGNDDLSGAEAHYKKLESMIA